MFSTGPFPSEKGSYILIFFNERFKKDISIGKLGNHSFSRGWYIYVGSARGPGGLKARLKHHLSPSHNPHWHIDYLKPYIEIREIGYIISGQNIEDDLAGVLSKKCDHIPVRKFGASDSPLPSHLFYFGKRSNLINALSAIKEKYPLSIIKR